MPYDKKRTLVNSAITIAMLSMLCLTIYFYIKYSEAKDSLQQNLPATQAEINEAIRKVGKHIQLPENETPTVATVSDVERLRTQSFFLKAENGDKVLVYPQSRKAYLYRPRLDKIIEVSVVELNQENTTLQPNSTDSANTIEPEPVATTDPTTPPSSEAPIEP